MALRDGKEFSASAVRRFVEPGGLKEAWRALAWLGCFALWVVVSGPVRSGLADTRSWS